jgi:hypothetical protein
LVITASFLLFGQNSQAGKLISTEGRIARHKVRVQKLKDRRVGAIGQQLRAATAQMRALLRVVPAEKAAKAKPLEIKFRGAPLPIAVDWGKTGYVSTMAIWTIEGNTIKVRAGVLKDPIFERGVDQVPAHFEAQLPTNISGKNAEQAWLDLARKVDTASRFNHQTWVKVGRSGSRLQLAKDALMTQAAVATWATKLALGQ